MNISVRTISHGGTSTNREVWVRVPGRTGGDTLGRVLEERQIGTPSIHCYTLYFPKSGEVAYYSSEKVEKTDAPS